MVVKAVVWGIIAGLGCNCIIGAILLLFPEKEAKSVVLLRRRTDEL
jgi:hypothetical protein